MAFNTAKYSITYADAQNRSNVIYLDLDGYGGDTTAVTPASQPNVYEFGGNNDDEYRALNPTGLTIRVKVDDTTLFDDVSGDVSLSWRVRWLRSGTEVWRGYLITDEIEQPFNQPSILTLRAVCGIKELDGVKWTASNGVDSFIDHAVDILDDLVGHGAVGVDVSAVDTAYYANWHSYDAGNAVSGDSFSRYSYNSAALSNPLDATDLPVASVALEQTVGRFGAKLCLANGKWRIYQRSALGANYAHGISFFTMNLVGGGTDAITAFVITDDDVYSDASGSNAPAYYQTSIGYYHYPIETGFLLNGDFDSWSAGVPVNWTAYGSPTLTQVPYNVSSVPRLIPINDGYVCQITDVAHTGTDYGVDAVSDATKAIYQTSAFSVRATSHKVSLSFSSRHIGNANKNLLFFYSIWLDGDLGTDYYWKASTKTWESAGGGTIGTPTSGSKMGRVASETWADYSVECAAVPDTGTIRVYIWNIVDKGGNTAGIWFRNVRLGYVTGDKSERVKTIVTATNANRTSGLIRPESVYFMGDGPSANHNGAILYNGAVAEGWKTSGYAGAEASSGISLETVHAKEILDARGSATPRIRLTFRPSSGVYWPHIPLSYGGIVYSCVSLSYDSRLDEYTGEWLKVGTSGVTITTEEEYSDDDVRPTDFVGGGIDNPKIGIKSFGFGSGLTIGGASGTGLFPRVKSVGSDSSSVLGDNFITGAIELATGSSIRFQGAESSTAGTYITDAIVSVTASASASAKMYASSGVGYMQVLGSTGYIRLDSQGIVEINDGVGTSWINAVGITGHSIGCHTANVDLTLYASNASASYYLKFDASEGDIVIQPYVSSGGNIILSGLYWPNVDGTSGQALTTNGSTVLSWATITGNATHTGEVTGATALTIDPTAISGRTVVTAVGADHVLILDATDGALKKALISDFASAGGDALVANPLSQFAATTSAQLAGVISDETGSGALVFATAPTFASIANTGVISAGTWQGGVVASAYLDADTAHLTTTQTFTGAKSFTSASGVTILFGTTATSGAGNLQDSPPLSFSASHFPTGGPAATITETIYLDLTEAEQPLYTFRIGSVFSSNDAGETTVGTVTSGTWNGTAIGSAYGGNATHTGEVTGATALTVDITAITNRTALASGLANTDEFLVNDGGTLKKVASSVIYSYIDSVSTDTVKCLMSNIEDVSVGNTGTETTLISGTVRGSKNISANTTQTGTVISIVGRGYFTTMPPGGGSDEINMRFKIGGVTVMTTGAFNLGFDAAEGWWEFIGDATVDTSGASGTVWTQGIFRFYNDNTSAYTDVMMVKTAVSSAITFTSSAAMDFTADWTTGDASNIITATNLRVDIRHRA